MPDKPTTDRRSFLKLAGMSTAGAVTVAAGTVAADARESLQKEESGYSETEHVKKVYELARF
ncbi:MAG: formate dehydrogenase [Hyphomicrobiales bacterium]|nr:formate dehydrogenase [Hyphomicrobiales bacterium]MCP5002232.1 formate dehydrogenase [Hyphomicrobiales bacterium]